MLDVDFFKSINDTYSHDAGDEVLKNLAEILKSHQTVNKNFSVCRWGGEEFLVLYDYDSPREAVIKEFDSICKAVEASPILYEGITIIMTVTIGLAFYHTGKSMEEFLKEADMLLYAGKKAGRNRLTY